MRQSNLILGSLAVAVVLAANKSNPTEALSMRVQDGVKVMSSEKASPPHNASSQAKTK